MNPILETALAYAAAGLEVFPAYSDGKKQSYKAKQYSAEGKNWGATKNPDIIRGYWAEHPDANLGVPTGAENGFWVIETDTVAGGHSADGAASLAALEAEFGALPATRQAESPSGSVHYYFRHPGFKIVGTPNIRPGIDVRGDGNMVLAPPSIRPGKGVYRWLNDLPVADAPQWLFDLLNAATKADRQPLPVAPLPPPPQGASNVEKALHTEYHKVAQAPSGTRNQQLNNSALILGKFVGAGELDEAKAVSTLMGACESSGLLKDDGTDQCVATINSALPVGKADPVKTVAGMFGAAVAQLVPAAGANATESTALRSRRVNAATLEGKPVPERGWTVHDLIPARNVTLLYGDGGTGKSLLELQMAACITIGRPFFGHLVKQGQVEFVTAEDSHDEMHRRLVDVARSLGTTLGALSGLHLTSLAEADALLAVVVDQRSGTLAMTALYRELETVIAESRPALVVLDTLADVFGGNEVIRAQARQFIGMLRKLCLAYDCAIIVLAHPSLSGMEKGTSGSTGWNNSVRSRLLFRRVHEKDGTEADDDARVLEVGKSNYGRVGLQIPMQWRFGVFEHTAGRGVDPMTIAAKADSVFLELLRKAIEQNNHVSLSKKGRHYAPEIFRPDAAKKGVTAKELEQAMRRLLDSQRIENAPFGSPSRREFRLYVSPVLK